ncbi:MAG: Hpt domain-containing protein [Burkholderiaceae bacterium]|nr:Hpt domain-containing protein [Burkholderiaceae bacterium]
MAAPSPQLTDIDPGAQDLGPIAWVIEEVRKSVDGAGKALKRFAREAELAGSGGAPSPDTGLLRQARNQLHQTAGALLMVGQPEAAHLLSAMEAACEQLLLSPERCTEEAASRVERAGFAVVEYLDNVLAAKSGSPVALFPQYREVQELAGADRVHPADLWPQPWVWRQVPDPAADVEPLDYGQPVRSRLDAAVLRMVKTGDAAAARELHDVVLGLAQTTAPGEERTAAFWVLAAAYFEALALGLLPQDIYTKRAASRVLLQYATLAKGEPALSVRLAHDLLFFCSQARPGVGQIAPALSAVRRAWGLDEAEPVNYLRPQFGLFDPALLAQARRRIEAAKEIWSGLSGGDLTKLRNLGEAFHAVGDSLLRLYPPSAPMVQALQAAVDTTLRAARPPEPELAMEVATCVLYLEAAFEDLDPANPQLEARATQLAERLEGVRGGGQPRALEPWMEDLYRRVSDRQTMGTVVGELRANLGELEKSMDVFFRNPAEKDALRSVPGQLSQMRGVLSVLGLDHAVQAVLRMRDMVEEILITEIDPALARSAGTFDKLGNNLGALGFLIDMLGYQPALAKKLFVYDPMAGELKPLMGRHVEPAVPEVPAAATPLPTIDPMLATQSLQVSVQQAVAQAAHGTPTGLAEQLDAIASQAALADQAALARSAQQASQALASGTDAAGSAEALRQLAQTVAAPAPLAAAAADDGDDLGEDDLLDIFLDEAREVIQGGQTALAQLSDAPADIERLTTLRRAFHTLKGSSRMVGLNEFGEAAWSMEQVFNAWLAEQQPASDDLRSLAREALDGFAEWVEDIAGGHADAWQAAGFKDAADAFRNEGRRLPIALPAHGVVDSVPPALSTDADAEAAFMPAPQADGGSHITTLSFDVPASMESAPARADLSFDAAPESSSPPEPAAPAGADADIDWSMDFGEPAAAAPQADFSHTVSPEDDDAPTALPATPPADDPFAGLNLDLDTPAPAAGMPADFESTRWPDDVREPEAAVSTAGDFEFDLSAPAPLPAEVPAPTVIEDIDFGALAELSGSSDGSAGLVQPPPPAAPAYDAGDDQIKVIGPLRIGIPLYNVYLNEADEWSRRLANEVGEWALEWHSPLSDSTVALAHSLAGSSATVGFRDLSALARAFEAALQHVQLQSSGTAAQAALFVDVAEDIRRLLHQFAAGFLKEPRPGLTEALAAVCDGPVDAPAAFAPSPDEADAVTLPPDDLPLAEQIYDLHAVEAPPVLEPVPAPVTAPAQPDDTQAVEAAPPIDEAFTAAGTAAVTAPQPESVVEPGYVAPAATLAAPLPDASEDEDPLDAVDAVDLDLFPIFEEEAVELLPRLGGALRQWAARPDNGSARVEALRNLHTLKGSARLAGAMRLGELVHRLESRIEQYGSQEVPPQAWVEGLQGRFDAIEAMFESLRAADASQQQALADVPLASPVAEPVVASETASSFDDAVADAPAEPASPPPAARPLAPIASAITVRPTDAVAPRLASQQAVRVRSQLLDRLVNQAGEVMITRSRLESALGQLRGSLGDLTGNLDRLRQQLRDIEVQAESQMQSRLAQAKDSQQGFDPLEFDRFTRVQELTRMMAESVDDVATVQRTLQRTVQATEDDLNAQARQTRELQRDLLRTRMVEFEAISERLYRVVRQASKDSGKQVKLDIIGGSIEMDRGVLDRMTPAFEHLLRNCVAHGIEMPDARIGAGKDGTGNILVDLRQEGNDVSVEFRDDGAGLDLVRIRAKAIEQGLIGPDQPLTEAEAASLIFMPGFSTAQQVSELAGRGIGMDVVRSEVNALGGRIETATTVGAGSSFRLVLPLTTAVTQVVMLRVGDKTFGVPSNLVELVRRASSRDLEQAYNGGSYAFSGEDVRFFWGGALLQVSGRSAEPQGRTAQVVVLRSAAQRVALHVDEVLGNQEVVVKNLGPQLARLPGLAGMTVLSTGAVVLIYNPVALAAVYGESARALSADQAQPDVLEQLAAQGAGGAADAAQAAPVVPLVLVVDDSITVRRVTQRLLQREGYRVALAADGLQALERLQQERPVVVLSDIEMPRMDGFDLARNIRADASLSQLPIIMITSRIAEKHREHAAQLGVNHYLGKPYSEEELLSLVRRYASVEEQA